MKYFNDKILYQSFGYSQFFQLILKLENKLHVFGNCKYSAITHKLKQMSGSVNPIKCNNETLTSEQTNLQVFAPE